MPTSTENTRPEQENRFSRARNAKVTSDTRKADGQKLAPAKAEVVQLRRRRKASKGRALVTHWDDVNVHQDAAIQESLEFVARIKKEQDELMEGAKEVLRRLLAHDGRASDQGHAQADDCFLK